MKRNHILAIGMCAIIVIAIVAFAVPMLKSVPAPATNNPTDSFTTAGKLYSDSVDLANAGKYTAALHLADQALAQNASSLNPIIQANRAGILVMMGRNEDAITAADAALGAQGNLTTTYSIAYFNKGNALRALGKTAEAKVAYAQAAKLDPTLINPYST
jgi:tetratricopeptide (TPR) repeat protein